MPGLIDRILASGSQSPPRMFLYAAAFILLFAVLYQAHEWIAPRKQILTIGLAGPMSGPYADVGLSMKRGAMLAIKDINQSGKLEKYELRLAVVDDRSTAKYNGYAEKSAKKLVETPGLIGIIGHYFSIASIVAGDVYRSSRIPFISPSATLPVVTADNEWAFSIMPDDYFQSRFLANYVLHGLDRKNIAVINDNTAYGRSLKEYFTAEMKINDVTPTVVAEMNYKDVNMELFKNRIKQFSDSDMIFLAMNYTNAAEIIKLLRKNGVETDVIGGESLGGELFIRNAGIYAEDVYAVTPYLPSLFGEASKQFQIAFLKEFQVEANWISTYSYEAAQLIAHALGQEAGNGTEVRNILRKMIKKQDAMPSIAGDLYFNERSFSQRNLWVGQVKHGRYIPARFQLTHIKYQELAKMRQTDSDIFYFDNHFMKRATVVYTGIYIDEIETFDPVQGNFVANFNLWFRWDPGKNKNLDFEMTYGKVLTAAVREKYFDKKTNQNFISYSVSARMTDHFPLYYYPFDQQILKIRIKPKLKTNEDLILVTDIDDDSFLTKKLDFSAWKDINHMHFTNNKDFLWSYRNPKYDDKLFVLDHSQYNYHVLMRRESIGYLIAMLPLLVLATSAYVIFTVGYDVISTRYAMGMTTILSAMSYHNVNKLGVGYLVRGDLFFLFSYVLFFLAIVETAFVNYLVNQKEIELARRMDTMALILYPLIVIWILYFLFRVEYSQG
ncbi:MAG: ABC transporter substrate-binding protein [Magnetococcales bacterium]|nr:ABC transporter substrate-binding protein [Magnetococcales bacterium]